MRPPVGRDGVFRADVVGMNRVDSDGVVVEDRHSLRRGAPDKVTVHANVYLTKALPGPERACVAQRAAEQPDALFRRVDIAVSTPALEVVVEQVIEAAKLGASGEGHHLVGEAT